MTEETMPAAEASAVAEELNSYELAFHVLPTVAEGEVPDIFTDIKAIITENEGSIFDEEAPQRFELAYEIIRNTEGRNRRYKTAYFGWIRATLPSEAVADVTEAMDEKDEVLRHLLIKLTKLEVENPIRFHEIMAEVDKKVIDIGDDEVVAPVSADVEPASAADADTAVADAESTESTDEASATTATEAASPEETDNTDESEPTKS